MKRNRKIASALITATPLLLSLSAHAAPAKTSSQTAGVKRSVDVAASGRVIAKPTVDPRIVPFPGTKKLVVQGEQYRLRMFFIPTPCNDAQARGGADDHKFECYGQLKVNGNVEWEETRPYAGKFTVSAPTTIPTLDNFGVTGGMGYSLNVGSNKTGRRAHETIVNTDKSKPDSQIARISLQLFDADPLPAGLPSNTPNIFDDKFCDLNVDVDLGKLGASDGRYFWFWQNTDSEGNKVGSNFYLLVDHVKSIYGRQTLPNPKPQAKVATGRRVRVETRLRVTNSSDGFQDNVVEVAGNLTFDNFINLNVPRTSAGKGADVKLKPASIVVKYGDSRFGRLRVSGSVYDVDKMSNKDIMWKNYYPVDLLKIMRDGNELEVRGDRDSESADLYIRVLDEGEVYD